MTSSGKRRALITGASSGIGRATALAFAQSGINVALVSRSIDQLQLVATEVERLGAQAKVYPLDLSQIDQVRDKISAIATDFGPIDILVNNAGMAYTGELFQTPLADWQAVLALNLTSVLQCIQGVLPGMRTQSHGVIINITSIAGHQGFPGWGAYSVSKAALMSLSKVLAAEERSYGIRVTTVCPGAANTSIWDTDTVQADFDRSKMLQPETVAQSILHAALLPNHAVIDELVVMPSAGSL